MKKNEYYNYEFDKFPKAKYILYLDGEPRYNFITTCRDEDDCLQIMKDRIETLYYQNRKNYKIVKKTKDYEKLLEKGTF